MSRSEESQPKPGTARGLQAVEGFWGVTPPPAFANLYTCFTHPFLAPCEFFALDTIAEGAGRSFGMLPQYLPFGRAVGEGGLYGFYVTPETALGSWPVLYWDEDEMYLRPVASNFDAFLRYCVLVGRYETEEQAEEEPLGAQDVAERRGLARLLHLPEALVLGALPRNDTELHERLLASDSQDAFSLCYLGCAQRARGNPERALDFFHRAGEAAPWFGDPCYLMADIYRERRNLARAAQGWWAVVQRLLPLCTRTWAWDLGEEHPEADIYEVAADGLAQHEAEAEAEWKTVPLWQAVVQDDPYDPDVREQLAHAYAAQNHLPEAEREYLNALSLCCLERGKQPVRLYDSLIALYERAGRAREGALARFDRALPRPAV